MAFGAGQLFIRIREESLFITGTVGLRAHYNVGGLPGEMNLKLCEPPFVVLRMKSGRVYLYWVCRTFRLPVIRSWDRGWQYAFWEILSGEGTHLARMTRTISFYSGIA